MDDIRRMEEETQKELDEVTDLYIRPAGGWSSISLLPFTFIEISYAEKKAVLISEF